MVDESSAGAIIFYLAGADEPEYLLLHYTSGHWDFPKGNIERGEDEMQAAIREILEETGITGVAFLEGFRKKIEYRYKRGGKLVQKQVVLYLGESNTQKVTLSDEHIGYAWKRYADAMNQLTYKNAKDALTDAKVFLKQKLN